MPTPVINSLHDFIASPLYTEGKFWVSACGVVWAISQMSSRVMNWFKDVKEVVLTKLQTSIDKLSVELRDQTTQMRTDAEKHTSTIVNGFKEQTTAVVGELREQRADLRMLYMQPLVAASPKARRKPAKLTPVKPVANAKPKRKPAKKR
jgi:hypothetical protein